MQFMFSFKGRQSTRIRRWGWPQRSRPPMAQPPSDFESGGGDAEVPAHALPFLSKSPISFVGPSSLFAPYVGRGILGWIGNGISNQSKDPSSHIRSKQRRRTEEGDW